MPCCGLGSEVAYEWRLFWVGDGGTPAADWPVDGWEDLEVREHALGLREQQPILVSPEGRVDPRLSECFRRSAFSANAQGTQLTYAPISEGFCHGFGIGADDTLVVSFRAVLKPLRERPSQGDVHRAVPLT